MHQKDAARQAWINAGLYKSDDARLKEFLKQLDASSMNCWPELLEECRSRYPEFKEKLVQPLWASGDKLLRLNLIRQADLEHHDEVALLGKFVTASDPHTDVTELRALALRNHPAVLADLAKKPHLPPQVHAIVVDRMAAHRKLADELAAAQSSSPPPKTPLRPSKG